MSVYTLINRSQFESLLAYYDIGELESYYPIKSGTTNSNYEFTTIKNSTISKYVLTIIEGKLAKSDVDFCLAYSNLLKSSGLPAAAAISDRHGDSYHKLVNKTTLISPFIEGASIYQSNDSNQNLLPDHCWQLGVTLAKMHDVGLNLKNKRANPLSLDKTYSSFENILEALPQDNIELISDEFKYLAQNQQHIKKIKLLNGAVHSDLFCDNILFYNDKLQGIIDFFNACIDYLLYDLAVVINDWVVSPSGLVVEQNYEALLSGYINTIKSNKVIYSNIKNSLKNNGWLWNFMLRRAALTFWILRLKANTEIESSELNTIKNPAEYELKLLLHKSKQLDFFC